MHVEVIGYNSEIHYLRTIPTKFGSCWPIPYILLFWTLLIFLLTLYYYLKLFGFPLFWPRAYLVKINPENASYATKFVSTMFYLLRNRPSNENVTQVTGP